MVPLVAEWDGPVYMRISRAVVADVFDAAFEPRIGKGVALREGGDVGLLATGAMVARCTRASERLAERGIEAAVVAFSTIKPLDTDLLRRVARETGALVTAEEHTVIGGFGSAVVEALARLGLVPVEMVGLADTFAETGPDPETLMDAWGLSVEDIVQAALRVTSRKAHRTNR